MSSTVLRLALVIGLAGALGACNSLSNIRLPSFLGGGGDREQATAARGPRIPVLATDQRLTPAEALQGSAFQVPDAQVVAEWPLPGFNAEQAPPHAAAAAEFQIAWRRDIGQGTGTRTRVTVPPVSAGGRIFVVDGEGLVSALDAATGARIWSVDFKPREGRDREGWGGGLAFAEGRLFYASGFRFVVAIDPATGGEIWRRPVEAPIHSAPNVAAGRLYVVDVSNNLHAIDTATGVEAWNYQALIESARIAAASSPAISGDAVIAAFASGELAALRTVNGNELWSEVLSRASRTSALSEIRDIPGRPVIYRGDVFAVSHSGVFSAIDARTGARKWDLPIVGVTTPLPAGDVVYTVDRAGQLIAAARESGQIYWVRDLAEGRTRRTRGFAGLGLFGRRTIRPTWSSPILASGRLVMVSTFGEAVAVNALTGAVERTLNLGAPAFVGPMATGNLVYVVTDAGELVAIQ